MYQINEDKSIYVTRGDIVSFSVTAESNNGTLYVFQPEDIVRISVYAKKNCENVVLRKDFAVTEATEKVDIFLTENDTKIGEVISKPTDYWYEIELNPHTNPQTIIGYDDDGAKVFKLFPEGDNSTDVEIKDIPVVDNELSTESNRPVENAVITLKFKELQESIDDVAEKITSKDVVPITKEAYEELQAKGTWEENVIYLITNPDDETGGETDLEAIRTIAENANATSQNALQVAETANETANSSAKTYTYSANVPYTEWTEDAVNGGYSCTIVVSGILATDNPIADVVLGIDRDANAMYIEAWSNVTRIVTNEGSVTLYANGGAPSSNFNVQFKVVR